MTNTAETKVGKKCVIGIIDQNIALIKASIDMSPSVCCENLPYEDHRDKSQGSLNEDMPMHGQSRLSVSMNMNWSFCEFQSRPTYNPGKVPALDRLTRDNISQ